MEPPFIVFRNLVIHQEKGKPSLLGCTQSRRFLEVDDKTLAAIRILRTAKDLSDAESRMKALYYKDHDLKNLIWRLRDRGFLQSIAGVPCPPLQSPREKHPHLYCIPTRWLTWMHRPMTLEILLWFLLLWLAALWMNPSMAPRYSDLLVTAHPFALILIVFAGLMFVTCLHELGHFFMARSFGVDAEIRLSHRFLVLVLKTDVTNAWVLPKTKRVMIFLAGLGVNLALATGAGLVLFASEAGAFPLSAPADSALRFFLFLNLFPFLYQPFVSARTDLYYVLLAISGERSLQGAFLRHARHRIRRHLRGGDQPATPEPDGIESARRQKLYWGYGSLFLASLTAGYALFFTVGLPAFKLLFLTGIRLVQEGLASDRLGLVVEGITTAAIVAMQIGLVVSSTALSAYHLGRGVLAEPDPEMGQENARTPLETRPFRTRPPPRSLQ